MSIKNNIMFLSDSYKYSHHTFTLEGQTKVYSFLESRGSKICDYTIFKGLQYILKEHFVGNVVKSKEFIDKAEKFFNAHFGKKIFNRTGWERILEKHNGYLPVSIKAVPEGTKVGTRNVLMTIENTDPEFPWITNFLETLLSHVWYPSTVATNSREIRNTILKYLKATGDESSIDFKCHSFGFRGVTTVEQSGVGDMAHLVSFKGTDTITGITFAQEYYNTEDMIAFSVCASEHSNVTLLGKEGQKKIFEKMLDSNPEGILACVSDGFDIMDACDIWGSLKDKIMSRNGTLVIRLDSGDAIVTILNVLPKLESYFGSTINSKGYKVLDSHIRILQGDGISLKTIGEILEAMKEAGWSADNIVFGSGGKLLQDFTRDTFNFAIKCSYVEVDGKAINVEKSPMEFDSEGNYIQSFKKSKKGLLKLVKDSNGEFFTATSEDHLFDSYKDELVEVFRDGKILKEYTFEEVRKNSGI